MTTSALPAQYATSQLTERNSSFFRQLVTATNTSIERRQMSYLVQRNHLESQDGRRDITSVVQFD